jgi:hypothetical protein
MRIAFHDEWWLENWLGACMIARPNLHRHSFRDYAALHKKQNRRDI